MVEYRIEKTDDGIQIELDGTQDQKSELLDAFQECQEGRCSCPTQEYRKLESLDVATDDDSISLRLHSKEGQELEVSEIEKCIDYTIDRSSTDKAGG